MAQEEIQKEVSAGVNPSTQLDQRHYLKTVERQGRCLCAFFRAADHICRVYPLRPFECRLYPFLLTKEKGSAAVSVHLSCPYVQEHRHEEAFERHVKALREYFRQEDVRGFVRRNPSLVKRYPQHEKETEHLFNLVL
jgi:Fe-S-cluster containining protein